MEQSSLVIFQEAIKSSGGRIFIEPVCNYFGIGYQNQLRSIAKDVILKSDRLKLADELVFGDQIKRYSLSIGGFLRWIHGINYQIVHVTLKEKLIEFQKLIYDFFMGGINQIEKIKEVYQVKEGLKQQISALKSQLNKCDENITAIINGEYIQQQLNFSD